MEEWFSFLKFFNRQRVTPNDDFVYEICSEVVEKTTHVLKQYGQLPHEGLVFWAGKIVANKVKITHVIAPETDSSANRVTVPHHSVYHVVRALFDNKVVHIGQVHSHPGKWVDHSYGDDEWAPFKREGLISLVVPNYCSEGMIPIKTSGVHRYEGKQFVRLSNKYIKSHFRIVDGESQFIELRDTNNHRWKQLSGTD